MTTLPNMGLVLPTRGSSGSGHWADTLDQNLSRLDNHDHSADSGARVPTAGISINADLSFSSAWAATALNRVTFSSVAPVAANKSLFVSSTDDELYWRSAAGANVKVTDASSLNVAAFTGGFGGDYTAVAAEAAYDDAGKRYTFKQGGGTTWARLQFGGLRLLEFNSSETVYVEQLAPAALAVSYTMTWPTAAPGSTQIAQIDSAGQWAFSNTGLNAITFASSQNITQSGTGVVKHGTYTLQLAANAFFGNGLTATPFSEASCTLAGTGAFNIAAPIPLPAGKRILAIRVTCQDNVTGPTLLTANLRSAPIGGGVVTSIASSSASSGSGSLQTLTIGSLTTTITAGNSYLIRLFSSSGAAGVAVGGVEVDYDHP